MPSAVKEYKDSDTFFIVLAVTNEPTDFQLRWNFIQFNTWSSCRFLTHRAQQTLGIFPADALPGPYCSHLHCLLVSRAFCLQSSASITHNELDCCKVSNLSIQERCIVVIWLLSLESLAWCIVLKSLESYTVHPNWMGTQFKALKSLKSAL